MLPGFTSIHLPQYAHFTYISSADSSCFFVSSATRTPSGQTHLPYNSTHFGQQQKRLLLSGSKGIFASVRKIIDIHTHIFPDALAERAVKQLTGRSGETAYIDGTAAGLEESMRKNGIAISVTQPVSTKPSQTPAVNGVCHRAEQPADA